MELNPLSKTGAAYTSFVVLDLLALAGIEIWFYAIVYLAIDPTATLAASVYFSTITYAAIGFSDASLAAPWRLVGAIEGINGVPLLGWSVAFLMGQLQRVRHRWNDPIALSRVYLESEVTGRLTDAHNDMPIIGFA